LIRRRRKILLQDLGIVFNLIVAVIVVAATELTIKWNQIQGVNSLASAGQTIPFAIGVALFIRIWYVYLFKDPDPKGAEHGNYRNGGSDDGSWSPGSSKDIPAIAIAEESSPRYPPRARQRRR
jgi:hypothetical protein